VRALHSLRTRATGSSFPGNFFSTFGVGPSIGRLLSPSDDRVGAPPVAVLSFHAWKEKFNSDPSVVGSVFLFDNNPFTIVGVAAPGFFGADLRGWGHTRYLDAARGRASHRWQVRSLARRLEPTGSTSSAESGQGSDPKALEAQLRTELRQWQMSHYADLTMQDKEFLPKQQMFHLAWGSWCYRYAGTV
jgi:hypothetical protein